MRMSNLNNNENDMETKNRTIVWAIDPFEEAVKPSPASLEIFRNRKVLPVSITSSDLEIKLPQLERYLKDLSFHNENTPEVLISSGNHKTDFIKKLISYSLDHEAICIALMSRGSKGLNRVIHGSFAERLIDLSPLPVLFLTEKAFTQSKRAIFATDFSKQSEDAFRNFIQFCSGYIQEVILFYVEHPSVAVVAASAVGGLPIIAPNEIFELNEIDKNQMRRWVEKYSSASLNVKISSLMKEASTSIDREVMKTWDESLVEIFGMATIKTSLQRSIFGSISREVIQNRKSLIWLWGAASEETFQNNT